MTARIEALTELAAKVEAGEYNGAPFTWHLNKRTSDAYHGSLDAAKALHDSVLPGWATWDKSHTYFGYEVSLTSGELDASGCSKVSEARAWLLAIIRALIAQEQPCPHPK